MASCLSFQNWEETKEDESCKECQELDLSYLELTSLNPSNLYFLQNGPKTFEVARLKRLILTGNVLNILPSNIASFLNLEELDVSSNRLTWISGEVAQLQRLNTLVVKNNRLRNLPKEFNTCPAIKIVNLSGNLFEDIPRQLIQIPKLKELYMGGNRIADIPDDIKQMQGLEVLYLGGNQLTSVTPQLGCLVKLRALVLCDNQLLTIPRELAQLKHLQSLSLHRNRLTTLPLEIIKLMDLKELSLRDNPLVHKFAKDLDFNPPSLLELSGRSVKVHGIPYNSSIIPAGLVNYLDSARRCINPKCRGVYFDSRVRCVKFVDFCGKFRLPLEQFLCSPHASESCPVNDENSSVPAEKLQKILLPF